MRQHVRMLFGSQVTVFDLELQLLKFLDLCNGILTSCLVRGISSQLASTNFHCLNTIDLLPGSSSVEYVHFEYT